VTFGGMEKYSIYGMLDPRKPEEFRVVGKTKTSLATRLCRYICKARNKRRYGKRLCPSEVWILKLTDEGVRPDICLIESCSKETWKAREIFNIALYKNLGHQLLNVYAGGNGPDDCKPKLICNVCGAKRRQQPHGARVCPNCCRIYSRDLVRAKKLGLTVAEYRLAGSPVPVRQRKPREDWRRPCYCDQYEAKKLGLTLEAYRLAKGIPAPRAKGKRVANQVAYDRDYYHASKLGLSVKVWRQQIAAGLIPDPRRKPPTKSSLSALPLNANKNRRINIAA
jgi:hypothetical protein